MRHLPALLTILFILGAANARAAAVNPAIEQQLFERVFGDAVKLDPAMVEKLRSAAPADLGKRQYIDRDGDGRPEEVWFIDTDGKHLESTRPLLVRVIDEDGDLVMGAEPDLDSDLYIADWNADGHVDRVLDYADYDGDGDADEQGMYFVGDTHNYFGEDSIRVWLTLDPGDHNLFTYYRSYDYQQVTNQFRSGFGPDQILSAFALPLSAEKWISFWENPFVWYDHDRDGAPEEVIRYSGIAWDVETYRHSMDADNDSEPERSLRDYDCSISAWAQGSSGLPSPAGKRGESKLKIDPSFTEELTIRGIPAMPSIAWDRAPGLAHGVVWGRTQFTWDEDDNNIDMQSFANSDERWEGLITMGHADFPQIGGPHNGKFNNRFELIMNPDAPVMMFYHPVDQRVHIKDFDRGWVDVDFDRDGKGDMRYELSDASGDGVVDSWRVDVDGDGSFDDQWTAADGVAIDEFPYRWADVTTRMQKVLPRVPQLLNAINIELGRALTKAGDSNVDPLAHYIDAAFRNDRTSETLASKYAHSDESLRFFLDCLKDRRLVALRKAVPDQKLWSELDAARSKGDLDVILATLVDFNGSTASEPARDYVAFTEKLRAGFKQGAVAWNSNSHGRPNINWESEKTAYRFYDGQIDVFGKHEDALITNLDMRGYHQEQVWGMDALLIGKAGGLGGLTLYVNGEPIPVRSPAGDGPTSFTAGLESMDDKQVTIAVEAKNIGATPYVVRYRFTALAGREDSPVEITVEGGNPGDKIELGVELIRMPQETYMLDTGRGIMASRGYQDKAIGWLQLAVLFPPDRLIRMDEAELAHIAVLQVERGEPVTYHIQADWMRGRTINMAPSPRDWMEEMQRLATRIKL